MMAKKIQKNLTMCYTCTLKNYKTLLSETLGRTDS